MLISFFLFVFIPFLCMDSLRLLIFLINFACILSFFTSLSILISFFFFKKLHTPSNLLLIWISISNLGISIFPFFGQPKNQSLLCNIQGFIGTYFILVRIFVSVLMTYIIYHLILLILPFQQQQQQEKSGLISKKQRIKRIKITIGYTILIWIVPGLVCLIPLLTSTYSKDSGDRFY